ncbi:MAG: hypothetical protein IKC69_06805 [Clostridia bacterium]|nr:hypothetical protein [Clostridia bacterium]
MKRRSVLLLVLAGILLLTLLSCSSDAKALPGRWLLSETGEETDEEMIFHFTEDGVLNLEKQTGDKFPYSFFFGTYVIDGKEVFIYSEGEVTVCTFSVDGDTLTLCPEGREALLLERVEE